MSFLKKYLKWISTILVLTGILLTNLNIYPLNIYFHGLGVVGWTISGFLLKDKAILTNFGLQIPLFVIGIYKISVILSVIILHSMIIAFPLLNRHFNFFIG